MMKADGDVIIEAVNRAVAGGDAVNIVTTKPEL
jgi:hypothetical protein